LAVAAPLRLLGLAPAEDAVLLPEAEPDGAVADADVPLPELLRVTPNAEVEAAETPSTEL
jgi:hypothetical protein